LTNLSLVIDFPNRGQRKQLQQSMLAELLAGQLLTQ